MYVCVSQEQPPEGTLDMIMATRIEEIRHKIQIESRVIVGAKNIVRTLSTTAGGKTVNEQMKKTIAEVLGNPKSLHILF